MGPDSANVVTLANSIIGVGILAMPFCFEKCGILLSIVLLLLSNLITRLSCHYLAKASILSRRRNYEYLAFYAFGFSGKIMVELCIIGYLFGTATAYHVVVGDLSPQIISQIFNITHSENLRLWAMIVLTVVCVLPLGLLKNIDSLSAVCTVSIGFYFCFVLKVIGESVDLLLSDNYGWMDRVNWWRPSGLLQCAPIFSMALSCQMQLFEVSETMPGVSLDRMNKEVKTATWICTIVYIMVGFFGYVAFCSQEVFSGNILISLSQSLSSDVIKIGFIISVAFSFPLVIFPCRASLYSLLYRQGSDGNQYIPEAKFRALTIAIVFCSLLAGLVIPSVELVIGLVGSTIGIAICIVFPACCFTKVSKKESTEKWLAKVMIVCGFCLMVLGTYANLEAIDVKAASVHIPEFQAPVDNIAAASVISVIMEPKTPLARDIQQVLKSEINVTGESQENMNELKPLVKSPLEDQQKTQLSKDAIKKEDEELSADKDSKAAIRKELNDVVDEIKRQNEETQRKVEKMVEKIVEKIEQKETLNKPADDEKDGTEVENSHINQVHDKFLKPIPLALGLGKTAEQITQTSGNNSIRNKNNTKDHDEGNHNLEDGELKNLASNNKLNIGNELPISDNKRGSEDDVEAIRRELLDVGPSR